MKAEVHITVESESELRLLAQSLAAVNTGRLSPLQVQLEPTIRIKRHRLNKVTRKMARSLIRQKVSDKLIAKQIGVSSETIRRLRLNLTWKR